MLKRLSAADHQVDREATAPERAWPRRLTDHTPLQRAPGARPADVADRAVPRPDLPLRRSEPQTEHAWHAAADRRRRRRRWRRGWGGWRRRRRGRRGRGRGGGRWWRWLRRR